jgi:hypothetical protein
VPVKLLYSESLTKRTKSTVELYKSVGNEQRWHINVENHSQINAPSREKNGNHNF